MRKRLLLIQPYTQAPDSSLYVPPRDATREAKLINFETYDDLLADVDWDVHPGPVGPFLDSFVETREEFATRDGSVVRYSVSVPLGGPPAG